MPVKQGLGQKLCEPTCLSTRLPFRMSNFLLPFTATSCYYAKATSNDNTFSPPSFEKVAITANCQSALKESMEYIRFPIFAELATKDPFFPIKSTLALT